MAGKTQSIQMGLSIAGAFRNILQKPTVGEALLQPPDNAFDACADQVFVIITKHTDGLVDVTFLDNGYGLFKWLPEADEKMIDKIRLGDLSDRQKAVLKKDGPAGLMTEITSCISYPYIMAFPANSIKKSRFYYLILDMFKEYTGRVPVGPPIGSKASGLLYLIALGSEVVIRSQANVHMARNHYADENLQQSDMPIAGLRLPTIDQLDEERLGEMWEEPEGKLINPVTGKELDYGTELTIYNITDKTYAERPALLAAYFAKKLGRFLTGGSVDFQLWVIEDVIQKVSGRAVPVPQRKHIDVKAKVPVGQEVYRDEFTTSNGYAVKIRLMRRLATDEDPVVFVHAGRPGEPVSSLPMFQDSVLADQKYTGDLEIISPKEQDFSSWDLSKGSPNLSHKPMALALQEVLAKDSQIRATVITKEEGSRDKLLLNIGEVCFDCLREVFASDDELRDLVDLPLSVVHRVKQESKRKRNPDRVQKGIRVRVLNEHRESVPDDAGIVVNLFKVEGGLSKPYGSDSPLRGNVRFMVEAGIYRLEASLPEGMYVLEPAGSELIKFPSSEEGVYKFFIINTGMQALNKGVVVPSARFEFHADDAEDYLVTMADFPKPGIIYININAPLFDQAYKARDHIKLSEAIAYPVVMGIFQVIYGTLNNSLIDKALRTAQRFCMDLEPMLKKSLNRRK